jgi:hypothetical protein
VFDRDDASKVSIPISNVRIAQLKLIVPPASSRHGSNRDPALVKLVVQALSLRDRLDGHRAEEFDDLAGRLGYSRSIVRACCASPTVRRTFSLPSSRAVSPPR